jgi:hypothetical protein
MTKGRLSTLQIDWAKEHDWFIADHGDGTITVLDRWSQKHPDGSITHHEKQILWMDGFAALRDWAGY